MTSPAPIRRSLRRCAAFAATLLFTSCAGSAPAPQGPVSAGCPTLLPTYPAREWSRIQTAECAGWSSVYLDSVRMKLSEMSSTGMIAVAGGRILMDYGDIQAVSYLASVRKSILSMLYGIYMDRGMIDLDETLAQLGIDDYQGLTDAEKQARVRHLLAARSGIYHPASNSGDDLASAPPRGSQKPGEYYLYRNWDFNALGTIFEKKTRKDIYDALQEHLAVPLQMQDFDRALHAKTGDSTGYLWWVFDNPALPESYRGAYTGLGAVGQHILVMPALDLVVAHKTRPGEGRSVSHGQFLEVVELLVRGHCGRSCSVPAGVLQETRNNDRQPQPMAAAQPKFAVSFPRTRSSTALDGRLLLMLSTDSTAEPRFQVTDGAGAQLVFGIDVEGMAPATDAVFADTVFGYPLRRLADVPRGRYRVQALLNRYETFTLSTGHTVKLPPDRGEGQQWNRKPGNLYSTPRWIDYDPTRSEMIRVTLDHEIEEIPQPSDTEWVKHIRIQSERLTRFYGKPTYLGAHVLLPAGFNDHPGARYPLVINHGHFPADLSGWRTEPPDPNVPCVYSARFRLDCYNRIQQEHEWQFFQDWQAPGFPRVLLVEIQHPTPYYDDSYAVNSASQGPWGDAIMYDLVPEIERRFRGIGQGWARFTYGGSTGGWEAMAVQIFYPDEFNGAWIACPDPIDFRAYTVVDIYKDRNAYYLDSQWKRTPRPGQRNWLGQVSTTLEETNQLELVLGTKSRSGQQWDIWEATYSPQGPDGYPKRIWDKVTGEIDHNVAEYWKENYDLSHILRRDWNAGLGEKLKGKLFIYTGDMDNYYLNNAVYLVEEFLESTKDPYYAGEVDYGDRAEHCWNGDHTRPNATSRLRYHQMFIPRIPEQVRKNHPAGADTVSWRY